MKREAWLLVGVLLCPPGCARKTTPTAKPTAPPKRPLAKAAEPAGPPKPSVTVPAKPPESEFKPITAKVKPYKVSASLKEVTNYKALKEAVAMRPEQEKLLAKNLFVCAPTDAEQLFYIYEKNDYLNLPSFVTTDAVLQLYHIFYDFTLRKVEVESLTPVLKRLTEGMLKESVATWKEMSDPKLKQAALKNIAYFGVAAKGLRVKMSLPAEAASLAKRELSLMDKHERFAVGALFPYKLDYSQFVPRGHYTRSESLKRFFRTMMWYGLAPFALRYRSEGRMVRIDEQIRQGLLLVRSLYRAKLDDEWATIYEPTAFYVSTADDHTPAEWKQIADRVFGRDAPTTSFADARQFEAFVAAVQELRPARIQARIEVLEDLIPDPSVQLRFMGQRYIPDSEILQRLSKPVERIFPAGLDVMAVLGSERARQILDAYPQIYNPGNWADYKPERSKLANEFAQVKPETWTSNLYWSWLHALKALLESVPEGFPSFMRNDAWSDKSVHTALASWAELRHDTILYGKQSGTEAGDGEQPLVKGYVEPNVVFYNRLLKLTRQSREGLTKRKLLSERLKERFEKFEELLVFLKDISEKELRTGKLTEDEYWRIRKIGGELQYLTLSVMEGEPIHWYEVVNETDRNMAVIADVHTGIPDVLEEGVGHPYEILVIVPVEGKLSLARGGAFSYYEFKHPMEERLTDEKWLAMLKAGKAPEPPVWTKTFLARTKPQHFEHEGDD